MSYNDVLKKLWVDYYELNPSVAKIHKLLSELGETIVNDHIAFRTYDLDNINSEVLSKIFVKVGYKEIAKYTFEEKKLRAKHYEHVSDKNAPKIFISELRTSEFSSYLQDITSKVNQRVGEIGINEDELIFSKNSWEPISFEVYERLREESEYAAWMYVYGFRANHFTVYVNELKIIGSLEELNDLISEYDFKLNESGGVIKGSKESFLKQSSILADRVLVQFVEGEREIPCCYYEFAERFEKVDGEIFNGFIASSADKIFESTDLKA